MTVEGDELRLVSLEFQPVDPRIRGVDQTQADALPGAHAERLGDRAVYRNRIADATGVARVHRIAEVLDDARFAVEPPVGQHPNQVSLHSRCIALLDNQGTV